MNVQNSPSAQHDQVHECLYLIEDAQRRISSAAEALSPVDGFATEWSQVLDAHQIVKTLWHSVNSRLSTVRNVPAAFTASGYLQLVDEGCSGYRHYLNGNPIHAGTPLEILVDEQWLEGRYEWIFSPARLPYLVIDDDTAITLADDAILRWPSLTNA